MNLILFILTHYMTELDVNYLFQDEFASFLNKYAVAWIIRMNNQGIILYLKYLNDASKQVFTYSEDAVVK